MTIIVTATKTNSSRDYDWLKASVAGWLKRTDLAAMIPDFVMLAEKRLNGDLRARLQNAVATLAATESAQVIVLPASVLAVKTLAIPGQGPIEYLSSGQFNDRYAQDAGSGTPRHYTQIGGALYLGPTPDAAYTLSAVARAAVPALADSAGTNWLIDQHAEAYLAATMCEALTYIGNAEKLATWEGKYAGAISALNEDEWASAGTMAVRAAGPTP
jgi:hypothetical protein